MQDHSELVRRVKADLERRHVNLSGACGAFEITKRVAWALKGEGFGLLAKPGGNQCQGYATDIVSEQGTGVNVDILGDGGGANTPGWGPYPPDPDVIGRWRPAVDPGDAVTPDEPNVEPDTGDATPYDEQQVNEFQHDVVDAYRQAGRSVDFGNVVWAARMQFDAVFTGYAASRAKHLQELRGQLGLR